MAQYLIKLNDQKEEDAETLEMAQHGWKWKAAMEDLDNALRQKLKYEQLTEEQDKACSELRNLLWETMKEYSLEF